MNVYLHNSPLGEPVTINWQKASQEQTLPYLHDVSANKFLRMYYTIVKTYLEIVRAKLKTVEQTFIGRSFSFEILSTLLV